MNFAHIEYLFALLVLIPLVMLYLNYTKWYKKSILLFSKNEVEVIRLNKLKIILKALIFILLIIGLADPILQLDAKKVKNEGIDIMVAMDISTSMLANDVEPNRLTRAKMLVSKIINHQDDNRLGLIFFAGKAYLQMPLSIDKNAANMYISGASPNLAPLQGTNIADAVNLAVEAFNKAEKKYKVLVIITDGEDHEGADDVAIENAKANGIIVHTIGIGTEVPTSIPLENGEFKLDRNGELVKTAINKEMISGLAEKGGGKSFFISNSSDPISTIMSEINDMDKKQYEEKKYASNDHQFVLFLILAFILMGIDFLLPNTIEKSFFQPINKNIE